MRTQHPTRILLGLALVFALPIEPVSAQKAPLDLTQYPEASPEQSLPILFNELRRFLKDADSISDFALCTPVSKFKIKDGKLQYWTYLFSLNSRNENGGYTGLTHYGAVFRPGKPVNISPITMTDDSGLGSIVNRAIEKDMRKCAFLPKAEVQKLLQRQ